jgi:hypothetical protein
MGSVPKNVQKNLREKNMVRAAGELAYEKKQNVPKEDVLVVHTKKLTVTMFWRDVSLYLSKPINAQIV